MRLSPTIFRRLNWVSAAPIPSATSPMMRKDDGDHRRAAFPRAWLVGEFYIPFGSSSRPGARARHVMGGWRIVPPWVENHPLSPLRILCEHRRRVMRSGRPGSASGVHNPHITSASWASARSAAPPQSAGVAGNSSSPGRYPASGRPLSAAFTALPNCSEFAIAIARRSPVRISIRPLDGETAEVVSLCVRSCRARSAHRLDDLIEADACEPSRQARRDASIALIARRIAFNACT